MVGGVSPGKGGKLHLGLPVFNNVKEVCIQLLNYFFSLILFISIEPPYLALILLFQQLNVVQEENPNSTNFNNLFLL